MEDRAREMIQISVFRRLSFPLRTINKTVLKAKILCLSSAQLTLVLHSAHNAGYDQGHRNRRARC